MNWKLKRNSENLILEIVEEAEDSIQEYLGTDHVQVFWKHKSIENQASDWLTR